MNKYTQHVVYHIDETTVKLLTNTIANADKLIANAEIVSTNTMDDETTINNGNISCTLFDINGEYFQCERFITCCICHVSVEMWHKYGCGHYVQF